MLGSVWRATYAFGVAVVLVAAVTVGALPAAGATPTGWLHTDGSRILDSTDADHVIRATSWFGMETSNCAPHGLWQIGLDDGMATIASFGFNAVRLPFSNECLAAKQVTGVDYGKNPELEGLTPLQVMDAVVARAKAHGLGVILDRHRPGSDAQSELWYTSTWSEARWIEDWRLLAQRYAGDPTVVGVDLHNEPHGRACWGCGEPDRDWAAAATRAGNAVLEVNPRLLVIVEGVEVQKASKTWWGGGLADAREHPVTLRVEDRLVYSTHDYPASVFAQPWFSAGGYPENLPGIWEDSWGYLQTGGTAPVLLGEFGTKLETTSDQQWLATLVAYVRRNKMSFAYWSFNPNSGDTGGLVKDDWTTPEQAKLDVLRPILGTPSTGTPAPTPTRSPTSTPSSTTPAPSTTTPVPTSTTPPPSTTAPPPSSPTVAPADPTTTSSGTPSALPSATGADGVQAGWHLQSAWPGGYVAELEVRSDATRPGWTVTWPDAAATSVVSSWGMSCSTGSGTVTCRGSDWGADLVPGRPVRVGVQVATAGAAPAAPELTVS